jgi:hypothetical protein
MVNKRTAIPKEQTTFGGVAEDYFKSQPNTAEKNCGHSFDFREGEDNRCVYCGMKAVEYN